MKKIVLVSNTSWYLYNFRSSVIKFLQQKGFEVFCIANEDAYSEKLTQLGIKLIMSSLSNKGTNPIEDAKYYKFLLAQYKKIKPAFIFHYTIKPNIYGSIAAHSTGIKSVAVVSGAGYAFRRRNVLNYITRKLYRIAARSCTQMWFVNKEDHQLFKEAGIIKGVSTKVLPGEGIDTDIFKRDTPYPSENKNFIFLLSARLLWDKGVGIYADASKIIKQKYPKVKFQLLGFLDAENPSAIKKEVVNKWQQEGLIDYLGETDNVKKFLCNINCFVLPSYYREGVPRALLEASSMEIPIIATDSVGCREVVEPGYNGFLCAVKDSEDLAKKMEMILNMHKSDIEQMGRNGREKIINEFHEKLVLKFYNGLLNSMFALCLIIQAICLL